MSSPTAAAASRIQPAEPAERDAYAAQELARRDAEAAKAAEKAAKDAERVAAQGQPPAAMSAQAPAAPPEPRNPEDDRADMEAVALAGRTLLLAVTAPRFDATGIDSALSDAEESAKRSGRRVGERAGRVMGGWLALLAELADTAQPLLARLARNRAQKPKGAA